MADLIATVQNLAFLTAPITQLISTDSIHASAFWIIATGLRAAVVGADFEVRGFYLEYSACALQVKTVQIQTTRLKANADHTVLNIFKAQINLGDAEINAIGLVAFL